MILDQLSNAINIGGIFDKITTGAIVLVVLGIFGWLWFRKKKNKDFNIDVGVHKTVGDSEIYIPTVAKQTSDDKGMIRFESKIFNIDLPAIESEFFGISSKGANRRYIDLWNPQPGIFLPMARDYMRINNKRYKHTDETECHFCSYVTECKKKGLKPLFKGKEWEDHIRNSELMNVCSKHINMYYQAKFKVVGEVPKQFMYLRMKERLLRSITHKAWYDNDLVKGGMFLVAILIFVIIVLKFGSSWFETAMHESAKRAGETYLKTVNLANNIPAEPPN